MSTPPATSSNNHREPSGLPTPDSSKSFWHSEPSPLLTAHRTTRELPKTADIVIIGSGITGTSAAYHLLTKDGSNPDQADDSPAVQGIRRRIERERHIINAVEKMPQTTTNAQVKSRTESQSRDAKANIEYLEQSIRDLQQAEGKTVVMLEAREACWGATGRNGGHCQPVLFEHPEDPSIPHFEMANFHALHEIIQSKSIQCEFVTQPGVRAIYSRKDVLEIELALLKLKETARDLSSRVRLVTEPGELKQLRVPTAVGAVVTNIAARMWPYKFVSHILTELLTSNDLDGSFNLQTLTPVTSLRASGEESSGTDSDAWIVETPRGPIRANKVVLATNAYTSHLLPSFTDLIVPCRGQMSALKPPPSLSGEMRLKNSHGFMGEGLDDYLVQRPNESGGHLMFGGGRQSGAPSVGVTDDNMVDEQTARYLRKKLIEAMDLPEHSNELEATHEWTGIMGFSRDDLPWIGPVPVEASPTSWVDRKNPLFLAAGYTGHGMPNTWLCGKAVAVMVKSAMSAASSPMGALVARNCGIVAALESTGLPQSYLITEDRVRRARGLEDVASRDWAEMDRARTRRSGDRPPSGYA